MFAQVLMQLADLERSVDNKQQAVVLLRQALSVLDAQGPPAAEGTFPMVTTQSHCRVGMPWGCRNGWMSHTSTWGIQMKNAMSLFFPASARNAIWIFWHGSVLHVLLSAHDWAMHGLWSKRMCMTWRC